MTDDVVPRYLVLADGRYFGMEFESEGAATAYTEDALGYRMTANKDAEGLCRSLEVVRSVRRWDLDVERGEMLEVGEKLKEQPV